MFDIKKATIQYQLILQAKRFGLSLPIKRKIPDKKVEHISAEDIDEQATSEAVHIKRAFTNQTMNFGKKLKKSHGEQHRAGGRGQW